MIHLHAVVWQAFEDSVAAGPSETDKDQRSAADEEYYSPEEWSSVDLKHKVLSKSSA